MDHDDEVDDNELDDDDNEEGGPCIEVSPLGGGFYARDAEQRESNSEKGTTVFEASNDDEDRTLWVVRQDWRLRDFKRIGVILDSHDRRAVVGRPLWARVPRQGDDAGKLMLEVEWDLTSPDPTVVNVGQQHLKGIRKAGSVSFVSDKITPRNKLAEDHPKFRTPKKFPSRWGFEFEDAGLFFEGNELREFSSAPIPANAGAVQRAWCEYLAEVDPNDVDARAKRAGEILPQFSAETLRAWAADPEQRKLLVEMLWPDLLEQLRGAEVRAIVNAHHNAGPPGDPSHNNPDGPSLLEIVASGLRG